VSPSQRILYKGMRHPNMPFLSLYYTAISHGVELCVSPTLFTSPSLPFALAAFFDPMKPVAPTLTLLTRPLSRCRAACTACDRHARVCYKLVAPVR